MIYNISIFLIDIGISDRTEWIEVEMFDNAIVPTGVDELGARPCAECLRKMYPGRYSLRLEAATATAKQHSGRAASSGLPHRCYKGAVGILVFARRT